MAKLELSHNAGNAVSLVERQVMVLRQQNQQMLKQLHELIEIARQNETLVKRMHQLALALMAANNPTTIFNTIYDNLKNNFQADCTSIRLFADPNCNDDTALDEFSGTETPGQVLFEHIIDKGLPLSGRMQSEQQVFLFGNEGRQIGSAVVVPLHGEVWDGVLAIGSFDAAHFRADMGVELLSHLGEILSFVLKPWVKK